MPGKRSSHKRKILMATLVSTLLTSILAGSFFLNLAKANFEPPPLYVIKFISPQNRTYATKNMPLTFEISGSRLSGFGVYKILVFLDGSPLSLGKTTPSYTNPYSANLNLTNLSEGDHYVEVWWRSSHPFESGVTGARVCFAIDTVSPSISIISPQNRTYDAGAIALNLTLNEPVSGVGYSLDGEANVTITEDVVPATYSYGSVDVVRFVVNTVLNDLSSGVHILMVYAEDEAGNKGNTLGSFRIEAQVAGQQVGSESSPFSNLWVAVVVIVSAAVVSFGLVAYLLRRKKKRRSS